MQVSGPLLDREPEKIIYRAHDRAELDFFLGYTTVDSFVQELCQGEEFSVDVFCDLESTCLNAIPRTMIQSKGGESIKGASIKDTELIEHACRVAEAVGIVGPANHAGKREILVAGAPHASSGLYDDE